MTHEVTLIVPCYNEAATIGLLLDAVREQTVQPESLEVLIVDGGSTDGSQGAVAAYASQHPELSVRLIDNPDRIIPAALNRGVAAAAGDVIIRLDAHSAPAPDYVERCLEALERTGAANVGGVWQIEPGGEGWQARAIAVAAAHPLGAGGARYRLSGEAGPMETVPFGAFRRDWVDRVGPFNEDLLTNEDYEYNVRIARAGGLVYFDPAIRSVYYARPSFRALARQYARYGFWKARMLLGYPTSLRWRQALPALFVLATVGLVIASLLWPAAWLLLAAQWAAYLVVLLLAAAWQTVARRDPPLIAGLPLAWMVMHLCWGASFWVGLISGLTAKGAKSAKNDM
jgi:succinoglycan biosynthesis protein ExoA